MRPICPLTLRAVRKVRRRSLFAGAAGGAGVGLTAGAGLGLAGVIAARFLGAGPLWWQVLAGAGALGLLAGATLGALRAGSLFAAALRADHALGLKDRLSTALSLARIARPITSSETLAVRSAEHAAASLRARDVVPLRLGTPWLAWPVLLAGAVATGVWMPERSGPTSPAVARASEPERRAAADAIAAASRQVRETATPELDDVAAEDDLSALEDLERELLDGELEPPEALAQGARLLEDRAEALDRAAHESALTDQEFRERLAGAAPDEEASDLSRALADGDLDRARQAASDLLRRAPSLTEEERARYAEELRELAEQLDTVAAEPPDAPVGGPEERLREQGIDPAELSDPSPEGIRDTLEERGLDPAAAEQLAEEIAEQNAEREAQSRARKDLQDLSDAARSAAEELESPPQEDGPTPPQPPARSPEADAEPQPSPDQRPSEGAREEQRQDQPRGEREPAGAPSDRTGAQPERTESPTRSDDANQRQGEEGERRTREGEEGAPPRQGQPAREGQQGAESQGEQGQGENQGQSDSQGDERRPGQPGGADSPPGESGADPGEAQGQEPAGARDGAGSQQGNRTGATDTPGDQGRQPGSADGAPASERSQGQPGGEQPGGQQPGGARDGAQEGPEGQGLRGLRERLDRLSRAPADGQSKQRAAEDLRERARRLLESASPEERERLERLAEEIGEGAGAGSQPRAPGGLAPGSEQPWQSEAFDARGDPQQGEPGPQQVVADWFRSGEEAPSGRAPEAPGAPIRQAVAGAERAIDRQAVPRARSDLVRRVFERFQRRAAEESSGAPQGRE